MYNVLFGQQQSIFDPGSGAAVSSLTMAQLLNKSGHRVETLSTSQVEHSTGYQNHEKWLQEQCSKRFADSLNIVQDSLNHTLLLTSEFSPQSLVDGYINATLRKLSESQPDFYFTFGDTATEKFLRKKAQESGAKVVFAFHNCSYRDGPLAYVDHYILPSDFLKGHYRSIKASADVLYPPMQQSSVLVDTQPEDRFFLTFVNPVPEKGLWVMVAIAKYLLEKRQDIPILFVTGRGKTEWLLKALKLSGISIDKEENLYINDAPLSVKDIMSHTRVAVMPSLIPESGGRVAMEAMCNGIPVVVSNRGALPEIVGIKDAIIKIPPSLKVTDNKPPKQKVILPWLKMIERLFDDASFYGSYAAKCHTRTQENFSENVSLNGLEQILQRVKQKPPSCFRE